MTCSLDVRIFYDVFEIALDIVIDSLLCTTDIVETWNALNLHCTVKLIQLKTQS